MEFSKRNMENQVKKLVFWKSNLKGKEKDK